MTVHPTNRSSAPQVYQSLLPHFLTTLGAEGAQEKTDLLWLIDSCQNKVSADQYHLTVLWALVSTHPGRVFFEVIRWQVTSIQMIAGSSFFKFIWNMLCLCHYGPTLLAFWFQTDLRHENSTSYLKVKAGKTDAFHFPHHIHALVTLYVQLWSSDWSKFDRWVHAENLYSILKLVYFDSLSWQSFFCQIVMFLTTFFYWIHKMKYSCYQDRESSVIHGWFVSWIFGWEMRRLSQSEIRFRMASFSFTMLDAGWKSLKRFWPYLIAFRSCISNGNPEWLLYLCLFVFYF